MTWSIPVLSERNGVITGYKIRYFLHDRQNTTFVVNVGNVLQYVLWNLIPLRNYSVQVAASTSVGFGPYSQSTLYQTHPAGKINIYV